MHENIEEGKAMPFSYPSIFMQGLFTKSHKDLVMAPLNKVGFFRSYNSRQNWSLPSDSIIYYILKNPKSPEIYQKLIKTCKYFFIKNPIIVISDLYFDYRNGWHTVKCLAVKQLNKIWPTEVIKNYHIAERVQPISFLIPKIYRCDIKDIQLAGQNVNYNDFVFLAQKCENIRFTEVRIVNTDNILISLEKVIEVLPKLKYFYYVLPNSSAKMFTSTTFLDLSKISHFSNIIEFIIKNITETFEVESFYNNIIKSNKTKKIWIDFDKNIPQNYKNRLHAIVEEILETQNHEFRIPWIYYHRMEKFWELNTIYHDK